MRVDGDGRQSLGRGHVAQVLAEARLVDRQVVEERQQYGRDHAMRDIVLVTGHFRSPWCSDVRTLGARASICSIMPKSALRGTSKSGEGLCRFDAANSCRLPQARHRSRPCRAGPDAQAYPSRPITMVVPVPAGGALDTNARLVAEGMSRSARPARGHRERHGSGGLDRHRAYRPRRARRLQHSLRRQRHARAQSRGAQPQLRRGRRFRADRADRQHAVAVRREERPAGEGPARAGRPG